MKSLSNVSMESYFLKYKKIISFLPILLLCYLLIPQHAAFSATTTEVDKQIDLLMSSAEASRDQTTLEKAVGLIRSKLKGLSRASDRKEWADTQAKLGKALFILARIKEKPQAYKDAIATYRVALSGMSKQDDVRDWAIIHYDLAEVLKELGHLNGDEKRMLEAVEALKAALTVRKRDKDAWFWGEVHMRLSRVYVYLGDKRRESGFFIKSAIAIRDAAHEYKNVGLFRGFIYFNVQRDMGDTLRQLGELERNSQALLKAREHYLLALNRGATPLKDLRSDAIVALARTLKRLGDLEKSGKYYAEAVAHYQSAIKLDRFANKTQKGVIFAEIGDTFLNGFQLKKTRNPAKAATLAYQMALKAFDGKRGVKKDELKRIRKKLKMLQTWLEQN